MNETKKKCADKVPPVAEACSSAVKRKIVDFELVSAREVAVDVDATCKRPSRRIHSLDAKKCLPFELFYQLHLSKLPEYVLAIIKVYFQ
jgi:hypothetical protein